MHPFRCVLSVTRTLQAVLHALPLSIPNEASGKSLPNERVPCAQSSAHPAPDIPCCPLPSLSASKPVRPFGVDPFTSCFSISLINYSRQLIPVFQFVRPGLSHSLAPSFLKRFLPCRALAPLTPIPIPFSFLPNSIPDSPLRTRPCASLPANHSLFPVPWVLLFSCSPCRPDRQSLSIQQSIVSWHPFLAIPFLMIPFNRLMPFPDRTPYGLASCPGGAIPWRRVLRMILFR